MRRLLLWPPDSFDVRYSINAWMLPGRRPDVDRAHEQWEGVVRSLRTAGADVVTLEPPASLPDVVFAADAGIVVGRTLVPSRFRYPERRSEPAWTATWFRDGGWEVRQLAAEPGVYLEGGDVVRLGGGMAVGHGFRTARLGALQLGRLVGAEVVPLRLVDPRFYHLDLALCPLDARRALLWPGAFSRASLAALERLVPEPVVVTENEALAFSANSVVVGTTIVMPACSSRLARLLGRLGLEVCVSPVGEFEKAGGAVRCLVLDLGDDTRRSPEAGAHGPGKAVRARQAAPDGGGSRASWPTFVASAA